MYLENTAKRVVVIGLVALELRADLGANCKQVNQAYQG